MKKFTALAALTLIAGLAGACATADTAKPLPQAQAGTVESTVTTSAEEVASTCDVVREALLTGTQADIDAAMAALQADRGADATAREYADYYLHRDATDPDMREMDSGLVRMACSS